MSATPNPTPSKTSYIPLPDSQSSAADSQLFAFEAEYFVHTKDLSGNTQILTVLDDFSIGEHADFSDDQNASTTSLFVEGASIAGRFAATSLSLSANHIQSVSGALDVSGDPIPPKTPAQSGDGVAGLPGLAARTLTVYCEVLPSGAQSNPALPLLLAKGGPGQRGQDTSQGTGGDGGKGGDGGTITVYLASPYLRASRDLDATIANLKGLHTVNAMANILKPFDQTLVLLDGETLSAASQKLLNLGRQLFPDSNNPTQPVPASQAVPIIADLGKLVSIITRSFEGFTETARTSLMGAFYDAPGDGAAGGSGSVANGETNANGPDPSPGSAACTFFADTSALSPNATSADNLNEILSLVNLTQSQMLLSKANMRYMQADSVENPDALSDAVTLFQRIVERLTFVTAWTDKSGKPTDPRVAPYLTIYQAATANLAKLAKGLDYYGNPVNAVSLVDLSVYRDTVPGLVTAFQAVETAYSNYFVALQAQNQTRDQIIAAKSGATDQIQQGKRIIDNLSTQLENVAAAIMSYAAPVSTKKQILDTVLNAAVNDIHSYYNFSFADGFSLFKDLTGAVSSVAFMPESTLMGATQGASAVGDLVNSLIVQPTTTITNDSGVTVNTSLLVNQIAAVKNTVDGLSESYSQLDDGTLQPDDPGAGKLLMQESQFLQIMNDFSSELPDDIQAVKKAFDDYISAIVARNNLILEYNAYINVIATTSAQMDSAQQFLDQVNDQSFATLDPGLPALATMMSQMYLQARDQLMQTFYDASRALQFWSLSNRNFFAETLSANTAGVQPSAVTFAFAQGALTQAWLNGLKALGTNSSPFPNLSTEDGAIIAFTDDATLSTFRSTGSVLVTMPLIRRPSGGVSKPSRLDPAWQNQLLVDQANIRLGEMRVWLDGVKVVQNGTPVDDVLQIRITHGGYCLLASQDDQPYRFVHNTVVKTFQYHTMTQDGSRPLIEKRANFGDILPGDQSDFALLSPFTDWTLELVNSIQAPTAVGLIQALQQNKVHASGILSFGGRQYTIGSVRSSGAVTTVTAMLYGIVVATFNVNGQIITDQDGAAVAEPSLILPPQSDRHIDLSGLSAIRLEFTGTSYTFN